MAKEKVTKTSEQAEPLQNEEENGTTVVLPESPLILNLKQLVKPLYEERGFDQILLFDDISGDSYLKICQAIDTIEDSKNKEIDVILHSSGGSAEYAYRIIKRLRNNFKRVNIIIPLWAKSAATLLSLGGSTIILDNAAELGPLDAQILEEKREESILERDSVLTDEASLANLEDRSCSLFMSTYAQTYSNFYNTYLKLNKKELSEAALNFVTKFYEPLLKQIDPYKMGKKTRITKVAIEYIEKILDQFNPIVDKRDKERFERFIVFDCPDHGFIIDFHTISKYLQNVIQSDTVSVDYSRNLRLLSDFLMEYRVKVEEKNGVSLDGIVLILNNKTYASS